MESNAKRLGYETLGPVVTAFAHLLIRSATRMGIRRLMFVARDGRLLHDVTGIVAKAIGQVDDLTTAYLHLSRRATRLAAAGTLTKESIDETAAVRAGPLTMGSILRSHGIEWADVAGEPAFHALSSQFDVESDRNTVGFLRNAAVLAVMEREGRRQRDFILRYLKQLGLDDGQCWSIVDVGWHGTIQTHLTKIVGGDVSIPYGYYFGIIRGARAERAEGLLSDCDRRGRTLREASACHVALLLEGVFRADEGTTIGYTEEDGVVRPVLAGDCPAREAERLAQTFAGWIRAGIVQYALDHADGREWTAAADEEIRRVAQDKLFRLAFFPTAAQISVARQLVHTESHAPDWSVPLIYPIRSHPIANPRRWLHGLASPWRSGYVAATGGTVLSALNVGIQAALIRLPIWVEARAAALARRIARLH